MTAHLARIEEVYALFPEIAAKRNQFGAALSGGQQQMLAVAQGVVRRPKLLMLDEPSAGLSPVLVDRVLAVATALRADGTSVLLVEQAVQKSLMFADRVYALAGGVSCSRRRPPSPTCRSGSSRPISARPQPEAANVVAGPLPPQTQGPSVGQATLLIVPCPAQAVPRAIG